MEAVLWQLVQFVQLLLWCSWSLAGSQAAATGLSRAKNSLYHVTQAANQVAQADCLQTCQIHGQVRSALGLNHPAAILVLHASWVGN